MRSWGGCSPFLPFLSAPGGHCAEDCLDPPWTVTHQQTHQSNELHSYLCVYTYHNHQNMKKYDNQKTWMLTFLILHATRTGCHWPVPPSRFLQSTEIDERLVPIISTVFMSFGGIHTIFVTLRTVDLPELLHETIWRLNRSWDCTLHRNNDTQEQTTTSHSMR